MKGFIELESGTPQGQVPAGKAIIRLINSVGDASPTSEWSKFKANPKKWLWDIGYRYKGPGAGPNEEIPANITLIPVYDTEDTMHIRIPSKHSISPPQRIRESDDYGTNEANRLPVLLASYFVRQCR